MSHLLIVKRLELYMDLALYKINILLLLLLLCEGVNLHQGHGGLIQAHNLALHHVHDLGLRELIVAYRPCRRHVWVQRGQEGKG